MVSAMNKHLGRLVPMVFVAASMVVPMQAQALSLDIGDVNIVLDSNVTIGAAWRMEERNPDLIGKSNLNPGLCTARRADGSLGNSGQPGHLGGTCNDTTDPALNEAYVREPGFFSSNSDNGNLNYDKRDMVSAAAKYIGDLNINWGAFGVFIRGLYYFDHVNTDFDQVHPDTTLQPATSKRSDQIEENVGENFDILDAYVSYGFEVGDRYYGIRVGDQVVNWGESAFLVPGSLNSLNPPDVSRLRIPGFDIKELFIPSGMVTLNTNLTTNLGLEAVWMYEWVPVRPDQAGTYFSTSDIAGGGTYAMLSFAKAPEDPTQQYRASENLDDPIGLISSASRTILRTEDDTPENESNQYGLALRYFAEGLNGGTEFGAYYLRYHSRFPIASFRASDATCIPEGTSNVVGALAGCGLGGDEGRLGVSAVTNLLGLGGVGDLENLLGLPGGTLSPLDVGLTGDAVPVDTATLFFEYPEDLDLYGVSFNTLLGDWAWSGEVVYRPETPLQIATSDLVFAALQPAFPSHALAIPGVGNLPNRRLAVPDYVTEYRGLEPGSVQPGDVIHGYEMFPTYNFETTFLRTIGGDNFLKASQIVVLLEVGATFVDDFPELTQLQLNGPGVDTHYSNGADGTISPRDTADTTNSAGDGVVNTGCGSTADEQRACRQNPTREDDDVFATEWSYGYRFISLIRYQDAIWGINLEPLIGIFHDIGGISPGPGGNFIEDRVTTLVGLRFDYLSKWNGEIRYTDYSGGGVSNQQNDRDYIQIFVGYQF
ncbi:MAG: DUF1302 domain-containing protein [Nevskiales bacterium]